MKETRKNEQERIRDKADWERYIMQRDGTNNVTLEAI